MSTWAPEALGNVTDWMRPERAPEIRRRRFLIALALVTLGAGAWRAAGLERESLFMDEIRQARIARGAEAHQPPAALADPAAWKRLFVRAADQQQPPLDYALQRLANQFSARDSAQRAWACLFGTLAVLLTGIVGARLGGPRVGLYAALFLALAPLQVEWSRTARPYTIAQAFWLLTLLAAHRAAVRDTVRAWVCLGAVALLFLLTRGDLPLFALAALGAVLAALRHARGVAALLASALLFAPIFLFIRERGEQFLGTSLAENVTQLGRALLELLGPSAWLMGPLMLLGLLGVVQRLRSSEAERARLALVFASVCGLTLALHVGFWLVEVSWPLFPKYLMYATAPVCVLAALGLEGLRDLLPRRASRVAVQSLLWSGVVILSVSIQAAPTKEAWRDASRLLAEHGVDRVWMFRTGHLSRETAQGPRHLWSPGFFGAWYHPIAYGRPLWGEALTPAGRTAIVVWESDFYDPESAPLLEVPDFERHALTRLHVYVPREAPGARRTLEAAVEILSRQPGAADIRTRVAELHP